MVEDEITKECRDIVEQVCIKFGYDDKDTEGNDSLKTVLLKAIPAMLKNCKQEDRRHLLYQMLLHTPIVVTENLTQESYNKLLEQYIGNDINQHIIDDESNLGEYEKNLGAGAYVSEPILDKNMNLLGKKSFIYIQKVTGKAKEFYGTDINVSHLIHELGHSWNAEDEQYVMQPDGTLKSRIGTAEFIYSFSETLDNKFEKKCIKATGLMIEEGMNTVAEEKAMADYMGISLEEMKRQYRDVLVLSSYQGFMADFVEDMLKELGKENFEDFRLHGKKESIDKINSLMEKTDYWINRETDILPFSNSPRSYDKKKAIIDKMDQKSIKDFFDEYESVYFPDISKMTPIEKIDNVLAQDYNLNTIKYKMGLDNYRDILERLGYEGYSLINQAADLKKSQELFNLVSSSDVSISELNSITKETKDIALLKDNNILEKGENKTDERT